MTTRAQVIAEAREWIGTPYSHQASLKGVGCDCIGFIAGVACALGLGEGWEDRAPALRSYGPKPDPTVLLPAAERYLRRIAICEATLADVLVLRWDADPQHFALVSRIDPLYIMHAYAMAPRKVAENVVDDLWSSRIVRAYAFRGIE